MGFNLGSGKTQISEIHKVFRSIIVIDENPLPVCATKFCDPDQLAVIFAA
ncbi:MAG TPA: hypothetical protein PLT26_11585 [Anaerolineaceae bacterium]|nr:hypothetical protein [Anaerolineaceae bacterium]